MSEPSDPQWWEVQGEQWKFQPEPRFQPGDKVVCIDVSPREAKVWCDWDVRPLAPATALLFYPHVLREGEVYVVRELTATGIKLVGVTAGKILDPDEWGFTYDRFVLLEEYRRQKAHEKRHGFWAIMKEMEAYEKDMDCYNKDGSLNTKGKKRLMASQNKKEVEP